MESQLTKREVEYKRESLGHEPASRMWCERVIAQIRAVEGIADDFGEIEHAAKRAVGVAEDQKADMRGRRAAITFDERREFAARRWRFGPTAVKRAAHPCGAQKRGFIGFSGWAQVNAGTGG